jgi:predicted enzyme related to lactoylglutathione lyase
LRIGGMAGMDPLMSAVDAVLVRVPTVETGLAFYMDRLGHELIWRTSEAAGLAMGGSQAELVISTRNGPETDLLVDSVEAAVERFARAGGRLVEGPHDIPVGKVAIVADPFENELVLLDLSKGRYTTDRSGRVTGVE